MRGKLEAENSELSKALGRDPRPAAPAKVASRGASMPSALSSVAELQRLVGASAGGAAGCMCSGVRHASPQVALPTGKTLTLTRTLTRTRTRTRARARARTRT